MMRALIYVLLPYRLRRRTDRSALLPPPPSSLSLSLSRFSHSISSWRSDGKTQREDTVGHLGGGQRDPPNGFVPMCHPVNDVIPSKTNPTTQNTEPHWCVIRSHWDSSNNTSEKRKKKETETDSDGEREDFGLNPSRRRTDEEAFFSFTANAFNFQSGIYYTHLWQDDFTIAFVINLIPVHCFFFVCNRVMRTSLEAFMPIRLLLKC